MASPYPEEWLIKSAEDFNIDEDFEFKNSLWAKSILDTVRIEVSGIEVSMKKALKEVEDIIELETFTDKLKLEYLRIKDLLNACNIFKAKCSISLKSIIPFSLFLLEYSSSNLTIVLDIDFTIG